jgi:hypothetical protein
VSVRNPHCACLICAAGPGPDSFDDWDRQLTEHVEHDGFFVVGVAEEDDEPGWAYSIGMTHTFGLGEIALFGLEVPDMQEWVSELCAAVAAGKAVPENTRLPGDLTDLPSLLRPMDPSWHRALFGAAKGFYGKTEFGFRQMIWADRDGRFPWDQGVRPRCLEWQPPGWRPVDDAVPALWRDILAETA